MGYRRLTNISTSTPVNISDGGKYTSGWIYPEGGTVHYRWDGDPTATEGNVAFASTRYPLTGAQIANGRMIALSAGTDVRIQLDN